MKATEKARNRTRSNATVNTTSTLTVTDKVNGAIVASFFAAGALIGLWSLAALVGGMIAAGGPLGLAKGYLSAFGLM